MQLQAVNSYRLLPYLDLQALNRALEGSGSIDILPKGGVVALDMQQCHSAQHATGLLAAALQQRQCTRPLILTLFTSFLG